jgi:hypothetical protein
MHSDQSDLSRSKPDLTHGASAMRSGMLSSADVDVTINVSGRGAARAATSPGMTGFNILAPAMSAALAMGSPDDLLAATAPQHAISGGDGGSGSYGHNMDALDPSQAGLSHTKLCRDRLNGMFDRLRDTLPAPPAGVDVKHKAQVLDYACIVLRDMVERTANLEAELALSSMPATSDWAARTVNEAPTFSAAVAKVMSLFLLRREWTMAELWLATPASASTGGACLRLDSCLFRDPDSAASDVGLAAFLAMARTHVNAPDVGIIGRVWSSMRPEWLTGLDNPQTFARAASARRAGLGTCFSVPITVGGRVEAVVAFFDKRHRPQDTTCLEVAMRLSWALGNAVGGKRASRQDEVRQSAANQPRLM